MYIRWMPWSDADRAEYDPPEWIRRLPSWLAGQLARTATGLVEQALASDGLRRSHLLVLNALAERGAASQAALGRRLLIDRSEMHALLSDLEQRGHVARVRDQNDRRRMLVELTPGGVRAVKRLNRQVEAAQDALLAPLTAAERRQLCDQLAQLVEHHSKDPAT
jgi:MarR family transcriptional regulator, lower aerobic nicotinate degradation pathway regulator